MNTEFSNTALNDMEEYIEEKMNEGDSLNLIKEELVLYRIFEDIHGNKLFATGKGNRFHLEEIETKKDISDLTEQIYKRKLAEKRLAKSGMRIIK